MKYKYLLLLLLMLPFVSGCNDSDDVNVIKTNMNNPSRITSIKKVHTQSNSKGRL